MRAALILLAFSLGATTAAGASPSLSLDEALQRARTSQPSLQQAAASTDAARARQDQAFASFLPQVSASVSYQAMTANFAARPGAMPAGFSGASTKSPSFDLFGFWNAGVTLNQLVWDFGRTTGRWNAAKASVEGSAAGERTAALTLAETVRKAYFDAQAARALKRVAAETLANRRRHLEQIQALVEAGTRPEIDVVQWRVALANARVQVANAEQSDGSARARLVQAMGAEGELDFEVTDAPFGAVDGEEADVASLLDQALRARPEAAALAGQRRAAELTLDAVEGGYWPTLSVSTGFTEAGSKLDGLAWNWNAGATLSWALFEGFSTRASAQEARANVAAFTAQQAALRLQVRAEVLQARLSVAALREASVAAAEAVVQAREQVRLAEGRYETGAGTALELDDAELALVSAQVQQVQSELSLAAARASLLTALGR